MLDLPEYSLGRCTKVGSYLKHTFEMLIFSLGQTVFILDRHYDPTKTDAASHFHEITIPKLYLLMGRELEEVESVSAGTENLVKEKRFLQ